MSFSLFSMATLESLYMIFVSTLLAYLIGLPLGVLLTVTGKDGIRPIPALSGVNTVLTDADALTVTGRADPIKRITDLEDAVASMTNT